MFSIFSILLVVCAPGVIMVTAVGEDGPPPPASSNDAELMARLAAFIQTNPGLAAMLAAPAVAANTPPTAPAMAEAQFGDGPVRRRNLMGRTMAPVPVRNLPDNLGSEVIPPRAEVTHASEELLVAGSAGVSSVDVDQPSATFSEADTLLLEDDQLLEEVQTETAILASVLEPTAPAVQSVRQESTPLHAAGASSSQSAADDDTIRRSSRPRNQVNVSHLIRIHETNG